MPFCGLIQASRCVVRGPHGRSSRWPPGTEGLRSRASRIRILPTLGFSPKLQVKMQPRETLGAESAARGLGS